MFQAGHSTITLYSPADDEEQLMTALTVTTIIDWSIKSPLCFHSLPQKLASEVEKLMKAKLDGKVKTATGDVMVYDMASIELIE